MLSSLLEHRQSSLAIVAGAKVVSFLEVSPEPVDPLDHQLEVFAEEHGTAVDQNIDGA